MAKAKTLSRVAADIAGKPKPKLTGITAGELLPQVEFLSRVGWGRKAFMAARDRGLPVHKVSRRIYVDASEAIDWMRSNNDAK